MNMNLFNGPLVRLGAEDPQVLAEAFTRWSRDTEYYRLLEDHPARAWSVAKHKQWFEKHLEDFERHILFSIRSVADDQLIGFVGLWGISWPNGE